MKSAQDLVAAAKAQISEVGLDAAEAAIRDADVLLDVREGEEFAGGHIAGAINIPRGLLEFQLGGHDTLKDRDKRFVVYCKSSGRAALAAQVMQAMGYEHVVSLAGGFDAWKDAGKPVA